MVLAGPVVAGGDGYEFGSGGRRSGAGGTAATACNRRNGEGEEEQELTAVATRPTASSGRNRSEAGRRGVLRRPKLQDKVGGDDAGLPASRESVMRKRESRRTSGTARRGEWVAVDAVALDGGDGRVRSG